MILNYVRILNFSFNWIFNGYHPMSAQQNHKNEHRMTWAQAFRDIVITAMNRGQFPILVVGAVIFVLIYRLNANQSFQLLKEFISKLEDFSILGWVLWVLTIGLWVVYAKKVRKNFSVEMSRVGREKSKAQEKASRRKLPSSNNNKPKKY